MSATDTLTRTDLHRVEDDLLEAAYVEAYHYRAPRENFAPVREMLDAKAGEVRVALGEELDRRDRAAGLTPGSRRAYLQELDGYELALFWERVEG